MATHDEDPLQRIEDELRASRARLTGRATPRTPDPTLFGDGAFDDVWPETAGTDSEGDVPFLGVDDHPTVDLQADVGIEVVVEASEEPEVAFEAAVEPPAIVVDIPVLSEPEDFVVKIPPIGPALRAAEPAPTEPLVMAFEPVAEIEPGVVVEATLPDHPSPEVSPLEIAAEDGPAPFVFVFPEAPVVTEVEEVTVAAAPAPVVTAAARAAAQSEVVAEVAALGRRLTDALDEVADRQQRLEAMLLSQTTSQATAQPAPQAALGGAPSEMEEWSMALARLVRSDSEALRAEVQRISTEQREALTALDALREGDVRVLNQRIDEAMLRVDNAVFRLADSIERRLSAAIDGLEYAAQMTRQADRQALLATVEDRVEALARLIRSDHEHLAAKVAAEQEAGKQALRSAKEVQASLPREIADAIDRRLAGFVRTLDA